MSDEGFLTQLQGSWWLMALRGVAAILFGVLTIVWPGMTLLVLVTLWGAYALLDGVLAFFNAFRTRERGKPQWSMLLVGLLGVAAGIVTFVWPGLTALVLLMIIAAWALVVGVFQIIAAVRLRRSIRGEWLLGLSGVLSVLFGLFMILSPGAGALAVVWIIAAYALLFGVLLLALGLRLRRSSRLEAQGAH